MESYEKKYKDALGWMQSVYPTMTGADKEDAEHFFPELKEESEDDRIRKNLIELFHDTVSNDEIFSDYELDKTEVLAWLEKQKTVGEIVERCKNSWYNEGKIAGQFEGITDDEKYQQGWHEALEKQNANVDNANKEYWRGYREGKQEILDKYAELEKQCEQKPVVIIPKFRVGDEIEPANEEPLTITKIDEKGYWSEDLFICGFDDTNKWKLVEQKPAEWSEEDKQHIDSLLKRLDGLCRNEFERTRFAISEDEDWLKSLKDRYTWKPSEEQISLLKEAINIVGSKYKSCLNSLYKDLKKL